MTFFPHPLPKRPANLPVPSLGTTRQAIIRDILWNQPVFKAPVLPNPRVIFEPLPFTATRVTQRPR